MDINTDEKEIARLYKEFSKTADELATQDIINYPLDKKNKYDSKRIRYKHHLIGMIEMYCARFNNNELFNKSITKSEIKEE